MFTISCSLGGGLANVAHAFLQAQVGGYNTLSPWHKYGHLKNNLHTVTFAGVMSMVDRDELEIHNKRSDDLLEEVGDNTVNFVFGCDAVPRGYGHTNYLYAVIKATAPEAVRKGNPVPFGLGSSKITKEILNFVVGRTRPLVNVAAKFRHTGTLIYYEDEWTTPRILKDTGGSGSTKNEDPEHFNHYRFDSYKIRGKFIETLLGAHSHFPKAFAKYISV